MLLPYNTNTSHKGTEPQLSRRLSPEEHVVNLVRTPISMRCSLLEYPPHPKKARTP